MFGSDKLTMLPGTEHLLAFTRGEHEDGAMFIFNISAQTRTMSVELSKHEFEETVSSTEVLLGESSIELPPWGWFIGAFSSTPKA